MINNSTSTFDRSFYIGRTYGYLTIDNVVEDPNKNNRVKFILKGLEVRLQYNINNQEIILDHIMADKHMGHGSQVVYKI